MQVLFSHKGLKQAEAAELALNIDPSLPPDTIVRRLHVYRGENGEPDFTNKNGGQRMVEGCHNGGVSYSDLLRFAITISHSKPELKSHTAAGMGIKEVRISALP